MMLKETARNPVSKDRVKGLKRNIDSEVFKLYGLTKDEIALVEQSFEGQSAKATKRTAKRKK